MQTRSSITITAPEPAIEPAAAIASKSSLVSSWSGMRIGDDEPPGMIPLIVRPSVRAAAAALDQVAQRCGQRQLVVARAA